MVALHNRKLTYRDVFPDNIWTYAQHHDVKDAFYQARLSNGQDTLEAMIGSSEDMRKYLASKPGMGGMQKAFRQIYPPKVPVAVDDALRAALEAIRDGHNDPRALASEVLDKY